MISKSEDHFSLQHSNLLVWRIKVCVNTPGVDDPENSLKHTKLKKPKNSKNYRSYSPLLNVELIKVIVEI